MLVQGDLLYQLHKIYDMMSVDELSQLSNIIKIDYLQLEPKLTALTDDDIFSRNIVPLNMMHYLCYL